MCSARIVHAALSFLGSRFKYFNIASLAVSSYYTCRFLRQMTFWMVSFGADTTWKHKRHCGLHLVSLNYSAVPQILSKNMFALAKFLFPLTVKLPMLV